MARPTRTLVRPVAKRILVGGLFPALDSYFPAASVNELIEACGHQFRARLYPPLLVLWGMIYQALSPDASDRSAVHQLACHTRRPLSARSGSYCKARHRLPLELLIAAVKHVARNAYPIEKPWKKRRILVLDGSTIVLADTKANQAAYPQPKGQKAGCGFPVLHLVVLTDHFTGCIVDMLFGSLHQHDARLARPFWDQLQPGDILLVDRGFASYALLAAMAQRRVDVVMRQHQCVKNTKILKNKRTDGWEIRPRPPIQRLWWQVALPEQLRVRVIHHRLPGGGILTLNTLLDEAAYSAKQLCDLYHSRWRIETMLGDLKTTMGLDRVYPKSPESTHRLIWAHALAYNLMCSILADVARIYGVPRYTLSIKGTAALLLAGIGLTVMTLEEVWVWTMERIAQDLLPHRPDRFEPRVIKRRQKGYSYLTKPRDQARKDKNARGRPKA